MKKNPFKEFQWERDGNGYYRVTDTVTGESVTAIPLIGGRGRKYYVRESEEREITAYGQTVPKIYDKFGVMAFCRGRAPRGKIDTHTREGVSDA